MARSGRKSPLFVLVCRWALFLSQRPAVGLVLATAFSWRLRQQGATLFLAYVLVPDGRIRANILSQERGALTGFEVDQANAKRA